MKTAYATIKCTETRAIRCKSNSRNNAKIFNPIWFKINGREEIITFYQDIFDLNDLFNFSDLMVFTHNIPIVSRICAQVKQFCYCSEMTAVSVIIV